MYVGVVNIRPSRERKRAIGGRVGQEGVAHVGVAHVGVALEGVAHVGNSAMLVWPMRACPM